LSLNWKPKAHSYLKYDHRIFSTKVEFKAQNLLQTSAKHREAQVQQLTSLVQMIERLFGPSIENHLV
jgi:hypothetical protein